MVTSDTAHRASGVLMNRRTRLAIAIITGVTVFATVFAVALR
jgi:hypothetical protein